MKKVLFVLFAALMMFVAPIAQAATVDGMVVDAKTQGPLKADGYVNAFWWNEATEEYELMAMAYVGPDQADFLITDLPEGIYYFMTTGAGYVTEYYNDTLNFDEKEEMLILEDDAITLDPIELNRTPFQFKSVSMSIDEVSSGGGIVKIDAKILNTTSATKSLKVWPLVSVQGSEQFGTPKSVFLSPGKLSQPKTVNLKPNTQTTATFAIQVPKAAPNDETYTVTLFGGFSEWEPTIQETEAGTFFKGALSSLQVLSSGPRTPQRVSKSGKVLQWK